MGTSGRYIFACDEHGNTNWPNGSRKLVLGGFVVEARNKQRLIFKWNKIKLRLCGSQKCELKWNHFFLGPHQMRTNNPLISNNFQERREEAKWALSELFSSSPENLNPINAILHKDEASDSIFEIRGERKIVNIEQFWFGPMAQFALFLKEHKARGEIWHDQLGSRREESRRQTAWRQLREGIWPVNPERQVILQRITPVIRFLDSQKEPLVQVADFVSGVIFAASMGDEEFMISSWDEFFPEGMRTYKILNIR